MITTVAEINSNKFTDAVEGDSDNDAGNQSSPQGNQGSDISKLLLYYLGLMISTFRAVPQTEFLTPSW